MKTQGVYIGRFCPVHLGHESVVNQMLERYGTRNCILVIGSANANFSLRNFFSYSERKRFLKTIWPNIRIVGLADFNSDQLWLEALDDILRVAGMEPKEATYFGGSEEDIRFFVRDSRKVEIVDRFGGGPKLSATEVRDILIHREYQKLGRHLNPAIIPEVTETFERKWEDFKRI